jgi:hypothetical protein
MLFAAVLALQQPLLLHATAFAVINTEPSLLSLPAGMASWLWRGRLAQHI